MASRKLDLAPTNTSSNWSPLAVLGSSESFWPRLLPKECCRQLPWSTSQTYPILSHLSTMWRKKSALGMLGKTKNIHQHICRWLHPLPLPLQPNHPSFLHTHASPHWTSVLSQCTEVDARHQDHQVGQSTSPDVAARHCSLGKSLNWCSLHCKQFVAQNLRHKLL